MKVSINILLYVYQKSNAMGVSTSIGTAVYGAAELPLTGSEALKQLWLVEPFGGEDTYRLRNIRSGTFFSLENGIFTHLIHTKRRH